MGESQELEQLVDYRNLVAHHTQALTGDIGRFPPIKLESDAARYEHKALKRVQFFRKKLSLGMRQKFVLSVSFRALHFESAERTYLEELKLLERKIRHQIIATCAEIDQTNAVIATLRESGLLAELDPGHPDQFNRSKQLTEKGINCCRGLFSAGASPFVVAHLMRTSLRAATRRYRLWLSADRA